MKWNLSYTGPFVSGGGAAIANGAAGTATGGTVLLQDVDIHDNVGGGDGGAVFNRGTLDVRGGFFRNNVAASGGAIANGGGDADGGTVTISGATIFYNGAHGFGGGVSNHSG